MKELLFCLDMIISYLGGVFCALLLAVKFESYAFCIVLEIVFIAHTIITTRRLVKLAKKIQRERELDS